MNVINKKYHINFTNANIKVGLEKSNFDGFKFFDTAYNLEIRNRPIIKIKIVIRVII